MSRPVAVTRAINRVGRSQRSTRGRFGLPAAVLISGLLLLPAPAGAVSLRDLVALAQAGLSDDILIALVDADGSDFALDAPRILELRDAGISERVILAMLKVSRERRVEPPVPHEMTLAPASASEESVPSLVIIGEPATPPPPPPVREVIVVPWFPIVRGPARPAGPFMAPSQRGFGRFMNDGWVERPAPTPR